MATKKEQTTPEAEVEAKVEVEVEKFESLNLLAGYETSDEDIMNGLDLDQSELVKVEQFSLVQPTSTEVSSGKIKGGVFFNSQTGEVLDSISFYPIYIGKGRVLWPEKFKRDDKSLCRSRDGKFSFDGKIKCADCPHSKWNNESSDPRPRCNEMSIIFGVLAGANEGEDARKFRISFSGSSISAVRDLGGKLYKKKKPIFTNLITMKSEFKQNDSGSFYVVQFDNPSEWSDIEREMLKGKDLAKMSAAEKTELVNKFKEAMSVLKDEQDSTIKAYRSFKYDELPEASGNVPALESAEDINVEEKFDPSKVEDEAPAGEEGGLGTF